MTIKQEYIVHLVTYVCSVGICCLFIRKKHTECLKLTAVQTDLQVSLSSPLASEDLLAINKGTYVTVLLSDTN